MAVDSALLEAGGFHQVVEGTALVTSFIEDWGGRLHDFSPGLLAFGHKLASTSVIRDRSVVSHHTAAFLLMLSETKQSQSARKFSRGCCRNCQRRVARVTKT